MTLAKRVERARETIARLAQYAAMLDKSDVFELRARQLSEPAGKLAALVGPVESLRDAGISINGFEPRLLQQWRSTFETLQRGFTESAESMLDPLPEQDARHTFFEPLKRLPDQLDQALLESWAAWIADMTSLISDEQLEVFAKVPALRTDIAYVQGLRRKLQQFACSLPDTPEVIAAVRTGCEEVATRWRSLTGEGIPAAVVSFLRAAGGREGAAYALLTAETEAWLREHGLVDALRIRLS